MEPFDGDEASLRLVVDGMPGLVAVVNAEGQQEYANRRMLEYLGADQPSDGPLPWLLRCHDDDRDAVLRQWQRGLAAGSALDVKYRLRRADGVFRWFHARANPGLDAGGQVVRWYVLLVDVDEDARAEAARRKSEQELRFLVDGIPGLLCLCAPDGELEYVNQPMLDLIGHSLEESKRLGWAATIHPDDREALVKSWMAATSSGNLLDYEYRRLGPDGTYRWFHVRMKPQVGGDKLILRWFALITDIHARKTAEEAHRKTAEILRQSQDRLSRALQIAAIAELSASIAHEISQPLAAVVANSQACQHWLAAQPPNLEQASVAVDRIVRDGTAAGDVLSRIRALFKQTVPSGAEFDLNEIIVEVCQLLGGELTARRVSLHMELQPGIPAISGDRIQIQQVLINLLRNGLEAMYSVAEQRKHLTIRSAPLRPHGVLVEIQDGGVAPPDAEQIFEAFFSTKPEGMGMGLAICRSIVETHGGRLWVSKNDEHGTTLSFSLPLRTPPR